MSCVKVHLGEALKEERTWEAEGVTVLKALVALPQAAGDSLCAKRFNRCYRRLCRAYFSYCAQLLFPDAAASFHAAQAVSAPWDCAHAALRHRVSRHTDTVWSVVCDAQETVSGLPTFHVRRSDVWDMEAGLPMPLSEFFPLHTRCAHRLLRFAREEALQRIEHGAAYRENWRTALRRALDTKNFYLTEEGLRFFYPLCALAKAEEGIVSFTIPYDAARGPFPPEQMLGERGLRTCSPLTSQRDTGPTWTS